MPVVLPSLSLLLLLSLLIRAEISGSKGNWVSGSLSCLMRTTPSEIFYLTPSSEPRADSVLHLRYKVSLTLPSDLSKPPSQSLALAGVVPVLAMVAWIRASAAIPLNILIENLFVVCIFEYFFLTIEIVNLRKNTFRLLTCKK